MQPIDNRQRLIKEDGTPTDYFIRLLQDRGIATAQGLGELQGELDNLSLDNLSDVDIVTTPPADGDALTYDAMSGLWVPGVGGGGDGSYVFIQEAAFAAAAQTDVPLSADYDSFIIEFYLTVTTDGTGIKANYTADNFATILAGATDYAWTQHRTSASAAAVDSSNGTNLLNLSITGTVGNAAGEFAAGSMLILNAKSAAPTTIDSNFQYVTAAGAWGGARTIGSYKPTTVLNGIRLAAIAGNITGFYKLYGKKKVVPPPPPAGVGSWTELATWDFGIDGAVANVDADVSDYSEVMVEFIDVSTSVSGRRCVVLSVDGGATYYTTSGNYQSVAATGIGTNQSVIHAHVTAAAGIRCGCVIVNGLRNVSVGKMGYCFTQVVPYTFRGSIQPITNVRAQNEGGGNFTAGQVRILGR